MCSYTVVEPLDGQWGMFVDGAYTGLIGQLQRKVGLQCLIRKNINFTKNAFKKHCGSTSRINMFYCKALGQVINKSSDWYMPSLLIMLLHVA